MKKGVYIYCKGREEYAGVEKKIDMQIKVLSKYFDMHKVAIIKEDTTTIKSIMWRMPFGSYGRDYSQALTKIRECGDTQFFYIRYMTMDRRAYKFICSIRENYPNSIIIIEFAAFPYKGELLANKTMWPYYFKDLIRANRVSKIADRYTTFSEDKVIRGIPAINISNGIIVDDIDISSMMVGDGEQSEGDIIRLLVVAQMQIHHGYERVIKGLYEYYNRGGERNIILDMVGDGKERNSYESLVKELGLESHVLFHGSKKGEELKSFYKNADIGLGSFGFYKIGLTRSSVLKMREYLAYGLPVTSACDEDFIRDGENCEYYKQFTNDDSIVDISEIVRFYEAVYGDYSHNEIRKSIHTYAKEHVDMDVVLKPIIDYLKEVTCDEK